MAATGLGDGENGGANTKILFGEHSPSNIRENAGGVVGPTEGDAPGGTAGRPPLEPVAQAAARINVSAPSDFTISLS
jgi:hypothetical protein